MGNVHMEASQINYRGGETKMSVEEALKNTSGEAAAIAALQTSVGNLQSGKANLSVIAPAFSAETAYAVGDIVTYDGATYRCTTAHEGAWDDQDFAATTISNELSSLESGLTNLIVIDTKTVTTDSDGDASLDITTSQGIIISVGAVGVIVEPWIHSGDYKWYVRVKLTNGNPLVGDASIIYAYVPLHQ